MADHRLIQVVSHVDLKCLVIEKRGITAPTDGDQFMSNHKCVTKLIDRDEWEWRFVTAKAILCAGYADTVGYYLGDVLGGKYV